MQLVHWLLIQHQSNMDYERKIRFKVHSEDNLISI